MKPQGRNVDGTALAKRKLQVIHIPGPGYCTPNLEDVIPSFEPYGIFATDIEPIVGLNCNTTNAQVNDVYDLIIVQFSNQAF